MCVTKGWVRGRKPGSRDRSAERTVNEWTVALLSQQKAGSSRNIASSSRSAPSMQEHVSKSKGLRTGQPQYQFCDCVVQVTRLTSASSRSVGHSKGASV